MPVLEHDPDVGGRYSVLSNVGLLPAAVLGLDVAAIREAHRRSGGVHRKLMQEIASQLAFIAGEDRL